MVIQKRADPHCLNSNIKGSNTERVGEVLPSCCFLPRSITIKGGIEKGWSGEGCKVKDYI
jgi:hypothetical protein